MHFLSTKFISVVIIAVLVSLAAFCYDLGRSANTIRPGTGDGMFNIATAAGLLTILTTINLTLLHKSKKKTGKKKKKKK